MAKKKRYNFPAYHCHQLAVFDSLESPFPWNFVLSLGHPMFVKGEASNFDIEAHFGVEASELYPEVKYTTVDEYMHQFV
ncbi:hypothetical protein GQ457_05G006470 [Hibiscus cannabinus]